MTQTEDAIAALRELIMAAESFRAASAAAYGVGIRETEAITCLRARGPLRQHDLGIELSLTPGTITNLVDRLESRGLATREPAPNDRRATMVTLTDLAVEEARDTWLRLEKCFSDTPNSTSPDSVRLLNGLARALREQRP